MSKDKAKYLGIFLSVAIVVSIVGMMTTHGAPLENVGLRLSAFGQFWNIFILPGQFVGIFPGAFLSSIGCRFVDLFTQADACRAFFDGGPADGYIFGIMNVVAGLLYGLVAVGVALAVSKTVKSLK